MFCPKCLVSYGLLCPFLHQPLPCLDPQSCPILTWPFPFTPYAYLEFPCSHPMFTLHSFTHNAPSSPFIHYPIIPHTHLSFPLHSLYLAFPYSLASGRVAGMETLGEPHIVMMTSLIVYCPKCLGSHGLFCPPPHHPLPCLDPQSCPMLTWRPFLFTPYAYLEFPHHTPCSPCIHLLIMSHVHLSFIHQSCPILTWHSPLTPYAYLAFPYYFASGGWLALKFWENST